MIINHSTVVLTGFSEDVLIHDQWKGRIMSAKKPPSTTVQKPTTQKSIEKSPTPPNTSSSTKSDKSSSKSDPDHVADAIKIGKDLMATKQIPKSEASMVMYRLLHEKGCDQEVIVDALIKGAALTPMGARTYFYNCRRKYQAEVKKKEEDVEKGEAKSPEK